MVDPYSRCALCPRSCSVDRAAGSPGFCRQGRTMRLAWAGLHFGEEPPVTAVGGSGALFFSGCTLRCPYCQNRQISHGGLGREVSETELAGLMLGLQERGAENINLVTAGHFTPGVVAAVAGARRRGLRLPVLWNSSGYESAAALSLLAETVDVFLPDCKTLDARISRRLFAAPDYPEVARRALERMVAARPLLLEESGGTARVRRGVMVRHLVLPGLLESTREVLEWFSRRLKDRALLSVMFQYTPNTGRAGEPAAILEGSGSAPGGAIRDASRTAEVPGGGVSRRRVLARERERVLQWLEELGIQEGYVQEPEEGEDWLPDFARVNPFPESRAVPLWHWCRGAVVPSGDLSPGR